MFVDNLAIEKTTLTVDENKKVDSGCEQKYIYCIKRKSNEILKYSLCGRTATITDETVSAGDTLFAFTYNIQTIRGACN